MKIALLQTGKTTDKSISGIADLYTSRIKRYNPFEIITIQDIRNPGATPSAEIRAKEGKKILEVLTREDLVVLLDEKGKEFRTVDFADWLEKSMMLSRKRIAFVIGGAWGFSEEICERADLLVSLSKMTFPHQLVRLLFLEQLYRAFTILRNEPYHHE
jgi:23S rRNA (pseudouridine1915-N3)-methyltransferase